MVEEEEKRDVGKRKYFCFFFFFSVGRGKQRSGRLFMSINDEKGEKIELDSDFVMGGATVA